MPNLLKSLLIGFLSVILSPSALSDSNPPAQPAWMTDAVVRDLVALKLSASQRALLQEGLGNCLRAIQADVHKITKRGGFDLDRKIKRASKFHWRKFEKTMLAALTETQKPIFQRYLANQIQAVTVNLAIDEPLHSILK